MAESDRLFDAYMALRGQIARLFVFDGSDVDFVFGLTFTAENEPARQKLQSAMMTYWGGFMHQGTQTGQVCPNGSLG